MRLTIIRHSIRDRGGDRLVLDYCSYLVQKGHEVVYWTNEVNTHFPIDPRIQIRKISFPGIAGTILFTFSKKFRGDIVLVDLVVMSVFAWFLNGKRVVCLAQDDDRTYYASPLLRGITGILYRLSFGFMKVRVISVSEFLTQGLNVCAHGRVQTVSNGVDFKKFYHEEKSRFQSEKKTQAAIVLYARTDYRKGLDIGIKAMEELSRIRAKRDWELWIIGEAPVAIPMDGLRIKRWGFLNEGDLREVLSAADIYLSPSRHEGFGLMQLEAMACGCVMVTTKVFSIVENEMSGLVSDVEDWRSLARNLDRVIGDSEFRERLRENGFKLVKNYSLEKSCAQFEKTLLDFTQNG